jgi:predicted nucleotidyltransferase
MVEISVALKQALERYLSDIANFYQLDHVILFGSWAKGNPHSDSDVDLAIFSTDATNENRLKIMADCLLKTLPYKLDIQPLVYPLSDYNSDNDFIQNEIIARGIEISIPNLEPVD